MPALPRLRARTIVIDDPGELVLRAEPSRPAVWLRRGDGIAASGVAWRGEWFGERRIPDAGAAWAALVASASIADDARVPGSGLVAFGAFTFDGSSTSPSVLEVPRRVIGRRDGVSFATEIEVVAGGESGAEGGAAEADGAGGADDAGGAGGFGGVAGAAGADGAAGAGDTDSAGTPIRPLPTVPLGAPARTTLREGRMSASRHAHAIAHAIDLIHQGTLSKVVLARDLDGQLEDAADRRHVVDRLARAYPECWTYAVDGLTGSSPEMLVRVLGGQVAARVLAGTSRRGRTPEEDAELELRLRGNPKDRFEHRLAIESAIATLSSLDDHGDPGTGLTTSPEPFTLALPNLWHLASDIRGTLPSSRTVLDLVHALHPTAAVGGTPTGLAMDVIRQLESFDRQRYAGPVGWLDWRGDGEFAVALRGAEIDTDGRVTAFAGGGIVADSNAVDEFAETELKFRPITQALGGP